MTGTFHHGSRVTQSLADEVFVERVDNSTIGIIGTAPDADPAVWKFNKPGLVISAASLLTLGKAGTLYENIETMMDQGARNFVVLRIDEGVDTGSQLALAIGNRAEKTGIHAFEKCGSLGLPTPGIKLAPGIPGNDAPDGIATVAVTTPGSGYGENTTITIAGDGGSGKGAVLRPMITNDGKLDGVIIVNPGYGYTAPLVITVTDPDGGADAVCTGAIGLVMNPLVAEAAATGDDDRSVFYYDLPDGSDAQAVQTRKLVASNRIFMCAPRCLKFVDGVSMPVPSSPVFAAQQAVMDRLEGPHYPGSNRVIKGMQGTNRAIAMGAQSNYLNENRVNTIISRDGLRTWGVWTCASDPKWQFINVVRTTDVVHAMMERAHLEFNDKPGNRSQLDFVKLAGKRILKSLEEDGWLLPGSVFEIAPIDDPDFVGETNGPDKAVFGKFYFYTKFEVPAPMTDLSTTAHRNVTVAYTLLFNSVTGRVSVAG